MDEMWQMYTNESHGIRISVRPVYLEGHSNPNFNHYVFAYFVRIDNLSRKKVQLLSRYWLIHDSIGTDEEVRGDGVVGEQPVLVAGSGHEYQSFCVLRSPQGYMEGSYRFIASDDTIFDAPIPRFYLDAATLPAI